MQTSYRKIFHCLLLGLLIALCYSNSLKAPFHFDDYPNIVNDENIHLKELTWEGIKKTSQYASRTDKKITRPVARLTLALNYHFSKLDTVSYHLVNISIHCLTACFLYLLFCQILINIPSTRPPNSFLPDALDTALLAATLWAIHPIQVQAVTYIVQRMASMAALFYVIGFYCYCRFRFDRQTTWRLTFAILAIISWLLGVFSKENAVLLPLAILCFELIFFPLTRKRKLFSLFLCFLFIVVTIIAFLILRGDILEYLNTLYTIRPFTLGERLLTEPRIIFQYLGLLLLPVNTYLTHESDITASTGLFSPITTGVSLFFLTLILIFSLRARKRFKLISFGILFFFINHLVESSFIGLELYFEHRNYLPSMFLFLILSCLFLQGRAFYIIHGRRFMQTLVTIAILLLIIGEGSTTWLRNEDWGSQRSLLEDAIAKAPENIRPRISIAAEYMKTQEFDKAKEELKTAEKLIKKFPNRYQDNHIGLLYYNAGGLYYKLNNKDKALQLYYKSINIYPTQKDAHANLGYLCYEKGKIDCAEQSYLNAIQLNMKNAKLYNMLGRLYYKKGEYDKAKATIEAGLHIKDIPTLTLNLIGIAIAQQNMQEAKQLFFQLPADQTDTVYLLYQAILDENNIQREVTANQLGKLLFTRQLSLCEWIKKVKDNNSAGVIFPNIESIEPYIRDGFNEAFNFFEQDLQKQKENQTTCTDTEEQETFSSMPFGEVYPLSSPE